MKEHIATLEGQGNLAVAGKSFPVVYRIEIFQNYFPVQSGAGRESLPGLKSIEGSFRFLETEKRTVDLFQGGEGILTIDDGRRICVNIPPIVDLGRSISFTVRDAMDFKSKQRI